MAIAIFLVQLIVLAIFNAIGLTSLPDVVVLLPIMISSIGVIGTFGQKHYSKDVSDCLTWGYIWRLALLFFDRYGQSIFTLPNSGADSEMFYRNAIVVAQGGTTVRGYFCELMGNIFRYIGTSRLWGQYMVLLCSIVALMYGAKIFELLGLDKYRKRKAMWLLCLLPNFAILSVIFLRESLITMFITMALYEYLMWAKKKRETYFVIAMVFSLCAMRFHSGTIAMPVGFLLSRLLYDNKTGRIRLSAKNLVMTGLLLFASVFVLNRYGDSFLGKFSTLDSIEDVANTNTMGGSSYAGYVGNSNNPVNLLIFTIPRMFFFLFSPVPWMIRGISDIIAFCFSSCFYFATMIAVFRYLRSGKREYWEIVLVIFIVTMCAAFVFGWGVSNAGTACRHRDKMTVVWGILYGLTLPKYEKKREMVNGNGIDHSAALQS